MKNRFCFLFSFIISLILIVGCGRDEVVDLSLRQDANLSLEVVDGEETVIDTTPGELHAVYSFLTIQPLSYYVFVPTNVNDSTPIMLFLHGNGDVGKTMEEVAERYIFIRALSEGAWSPDFILIMPIGTEPSHWDKEIGNIGVIISEVVNTYGGDTGNMYISGASAGADGLNAVAGAFDFKGAIFMAGNINGGYMTADEVLELWQGKPVYYYRDNLMTNGGYGYNPTLLNQLTAGADSYGVDFRATDLNWNHTAGLVDATFLPTSFKDANDQYCHNGINQMIFNE